MEATADLRSEHQGVLRMLRIMEAMASDTTADTTPENVDEVLEFLRVFVDQCHHGKEEAELFPAIRAADLIEVEPTLTALLEDHAAGRETVGAIASANERARSGDAAAAVERGEAMLRYTARLRHHIDVEERDCFDPADERLPEDVQARLAEAYDRIEEVVIGAGRHEAFHAMLDRLEHSMGIAVTR